MSDPKQASFDGWAIVDVLGHQRYVGYVTTEALPSGDSVAKPDLPVVREAAVAIPDGER